MHSHHNMLLGSEKLILVSKFFIKKKTSLENKKHANKLKKHVSYELPSWHISK